MAIKDWDTAIYVLERLNSHGIFPASLCWTWFEECEDSDLATRAQMRTYNYKQIQYKTRNSGFLIDDIDKSSLYVIGYDVAMDLGFYLLPYERMQPLIKANPGHQFVTVYEMLGGTKPFVNPQRVGKDFDTAQL